MVSILKNIALEEDEIVKAFIVVTKNENSRQPLNLRLYPTESDTLDYLHELADNANVTILRVFSINEFGKTSPLEARIENFRMVLKDVPEFVKG